MTELKTAQCRRCFLTRPIADLHVPAGLREYWCVDRERCHQDEDGFDGCTIACRRKAKHTLRWGECDLAEEPARQAPEFGFWRTFTAEDGYPSIGMATIPLLAVLPWAKHLTVNQQHEMLEEVSDSDDPAACVQRWWARTVPAQQAEVDRQEAEGWEAFRRHEEAKVSRDA